MPKALFFPSYRGGGFGHIGRCLALAQELAGRGWQTAFVLEGQHARRVEAAGQLVLRPRRPLLSAVGRFARLLRRGSRRAPAYTLISDMNFQIVRDGFHNPETVHQRVEQELAIVNRFKPDVLIGDTWPLTSIVGRRVGLPVVQIIKSIVHPDHPQLIWWDQPPASLISPDIQGVFNPVLTDWRMSPIKRAEDLLCGDLLLVPSIPELDPLPEGLSDTHYVGPLTRPSSPPLKSAAWFEQLSSDRPLVYVTIGGGADPVGSARLFQVLFDALGDLSVQVVASTSAKFNPRELPTPPMNFMLKSWVPGPALIARSAAVVFHGGYGTMMETVSHGTPSVVIPFHTEQESNGRRLAQNGVARVLPYSQGPYQPLHQSWPGGEYCLLVASDPTLTADLVRRAVADVLFRNEFRQSALSLQAKLNRYRGSRQAADLVQEKI